MLNASDIVKILELEPLEREGGWFRRSWTSGVPGYGSCIYYLMDRSAGEFSCLHVLSQDEVFHYYGGSPAEMFLFSPDGHYKRCLLGMDLANGERPQITVPAGTVQGSRVVEGGSWTLLGTSMAPEFHWEMFSLPDIKSLKDCFPDQREIIENMALKS